MAWKKVCLRFASFFLNCLHMFCSVTTLYSCLLTFMVLQQPTSETAAPAAQGAQTVWPSLRDAKEQKVTKKAAPATQVGTRSTFASPCLVVF